MKKRCMIGAVCALTLLAVVCSAAEIAPKQLVASKCASCHSMKRVCRAVGNKDAAGWNATVGRMAAKGLRLSEKQQKEIVTYLVEVESSKAEFCGQ